MTVSKSNLEKLTKDKLVSEVINLHDQIEVLSNQPLTSSQVVKKQLNLAERATQADVTIKDLETQKVLALDRLSKEFELEQVRTVEEVMAEYKKLQTKIKDAKTAAQSQLLKVEAETVEKIDKLQKQLEEAKAAGSKEVEQLEAQVSEVEQSTADRIDDIHKMHARDLEELTYKNSQALKTENTDFMEKISKQLGLSVLPSDELTNLKNVERINAETLKKESDAAVAKATNAVKATYEGKLKDASHASEMKINTLETQKASLEDTNTMLRAQVATLEAQVKEIPTVIKDAVQAAKADVTVNADNGKK